MLEITEVLLGYRECARHIWNAHVIAGADQDVDWDLRDQFEDAIAILFSAIVLRKVGYSDREVKQAYWSPLEPFNFLRVIPNGTAPILINREVASGYWDHPIQKLEESDADMRFVGFFDWNVLEYREFEFIQVVIVSSASHPELAGRHALVKPQYVSIFFDETAA